MTAFEARIDQFLPNGRQITDMRAKEIDPLSAGDLCIEIVFLRYLPQYDELVGGDLPTRDARHHRIASAFLDIGKIPVVTILDGGLFDDGFVPQTCENACHHGFAHLTAVALAPTRQGSVIGADLVDLHQIEKLLPGMIKMFADDIADIDPTRLHRSRDQVFYQLDTTAATGTRPGTFLHYIDGGRLQLRHGGTEDRLGHRLATTDKCLIRQAHHTGAFSSSLPAAKDQRRRIGG